MNTIRFNVTIEKEIGIRLRKVANKSRFISQALREKLERAEQEKKVKSLRNAYIASCKEDRKIASDWDSTAGDSLP